MLVSLQLEKKHAPVARAKNYKYLMPNRPESTLSQGLHSYINITYNCFFFVVVVVVVDIFATSSLNILIDNYYKLQYCPSISNVDSTIHSFVE